MEFYVIYLRKSRQDSELETVEEVLQKHELQLQEFAIRIFGKKIEEKYIFREVVSGETIQDRPMMQEVLKLIQDKKCKGVLVVEPQRLTRGNLGEIFTITTAFQYSKTLVYTPNKIFDLENKYDREFFERELLRGKDYVEYTREILMRGRTNSCSQGYFVGSVTPYGYSRVKDGMGYVLIPKEDEALYVPMIYDWYINEGLGHTRICDRLHEIGATPRKGDRFHVSTIRQILENEVYYGVIPWGKKKVTKVYEDGQILKKRPRNDAYTLFKGKHNPLITKEVFELAQARKGAQTKEKFDTTLKNEFASLIKCKKCGGAIAMRIHRTKGEVYRKDRLYCRSGKHCTNMSTNFDEVRSAIIQSLKVSLEDYKVKLENNDMSYIDNHNKMIENYKKKVATLKAKQVELFEYFEDKTYTREEFLERKKILNEELKEAEKKLEDLRENKPQPVNHEQKYYSLFEALNSLDNPLISAKTKNNLLKSIVEVIWYEKTRDGVTLDIILKD